jgi:hypothetical protein
MLEKFRKEYAYTEFKDIDWDAREKEFRPRFEEADKNKDAHAYALALRDFVWSIPDTHVGMDTSALNDDFSADIAFLVTETSQSDWEKAQRDFQTWNAGLGANCEKLFFDGKARDWRHRRRSMRRRCIRQVRRR